MEVLDKIVGVFPSYFRDLIALLTAPKSFVTVRAARKGSLERAMAFLAVSVVINFLLKLPMYPGEFIVQLGQTAVFSLFLWLPAGGVIWLACRAVGGNGAIDRTLTVSFYYFGVLEYIMSLTALAFLGALRTIDPPLYQEFNDALHDGRLYAFLLDVNRLLGSVGMRIALLVAAAGLIAALAWVVAGWGAFRSVHHVARLRSAGAFIVAAVLWLPIWAATGLLANALVPQAQHAGSSSASFSEGRSRAGGP